MSHEATTMRVSGRWLALASLLLAVSLSAHGPIDPDLGRQMQMIADGSARWAVAHWGAAAALSFFAVAGLVVLAGRTRLTEGPWTMSAWAVLPVSALWTATTAVAEATAVTDAAVAGNTVMFDAWWAFSEGKATGFAFTALALAVVAGDDARRGGVTPAVAAWIAAVAGVASFAGWALGMWFGIRPGTLLWLGASVVLCLWILWLGVGLARSEGESD
jgi:hypothetical protein